MRTNKDNITHVKDRIRYEAPRMTIQNVELEYSVAAGSVNNSLMESWQTETQSQEVEWQ